jgi:hypothetical protein
MRRKMVGGEKTRWEFHTSGWCCVACCGKVDAEIIDVKREFHSRYGISGISILCVFVGKFNETFIHSPPTPLTSSFSYEIIRKQFFFLIMRKHKRGVRRTTSEQQH